MHVQRPRCGQALAVAATRLDATGGPYSTSVGPFMRVACTPLAVMTIVAVAAAGSAATARAQPQGSAPQSCITAVNAAAAGVAKAQGKMTGGCLQAAALGEDAVALQNCLSADTRGRGTKARKRPAA